MPPDVEPDIERRIGTDRRLDLDAEEARPLDVRVFGQHDGQIDGHGVLIGTVAATVLVGPTQ